MPEPRLETTTRAGRRLAWRRLDPAGGDAPPLLLINGYAATALDWDPTFVGALGKRHELICPDNRGLGESDLGDLESEPLSIESMADDLVAVLDELGLERVAVAGWSMGGFIAQALARRDRVEAMALIATDAGGPDAEPAKPEVWARLTDKSGTPREQASRLIGTLFPPGEAEQIDNEFGEQVAAARAELDPQALAAQEVAMDQWHARPRPPAPAGAPPVLAVCGSDDEVIPASNTAALARAWPVCGTLVLQGCTHGLMAQRPEGLAGLISDFALDPSPPAGATTIREAEAGDAEAVTGIWTEAYVTLGVGGRSEPYAPADFEASARAGTVWVAESNGQFVGAVALAPPGAAGNAVAEDGEAELSRLAVAARRRGRGIGRQLVERCERHARAEGWPAIALWSRPLQVEAHRLYESLGYARVPDRDSVDETGHERWVFRRDLRQDG